MGLFWGAERQGSFDWDAGDFTVFSLSSLPFYYGQNWKYIKFWGYRRKGWGCREKPPAPMLFTMDLCTSKPNPPTLLPLLKIV